MEWMRKDFSSSFWSALRSVTQWIWCVAGGMKSWLGKVFPKNYQFFAQILSRSPHRCLLPDFFFAAISCFFFQLISIIFSRTTKFKLLRIFQGKAIDIFSTFFLLQEFSPVFLEMLATLKKNYFTIFLFLRKEIIQWETRERNEITTFDDLVTNKTERIFTKKLRKKRLRAREASSFGYIRRYTRWEGKLGGCI